MAEVDFTSRGAGRVVADADRISQSLDRVGTSLKNVQLGNQNLLAGVSQISRQAFTAGTQAFAQTAGLASGNTDLSGFIRSAGAGVGGIAGAGAGFALGNMVLPGIGGFIGEAIGATAGAVLGDLIGNTLGEAIGDQNSMISGMMTEAGRMFSEFDEALYNIALPDIAAAHSRIDQLEAEQQGERNRRERARRAVTEDARQAAQIELMHMRQSRVPRTAPI